MTEQTSPPPIEETPDQARQGEPKKGMPLVLALSTLAAAALLLLLLAAFVVG